MIINWEGASIRKKVECRSGIKMEKHGAVRKLVPGLFWGERVSSRSGTLYSWTFGT